MSEAVVVDRGTFLGHPKGLYVLFFAEMWERFSFYGMRGLLIFYLTQHFLFSDRVATGIYATYGSLVYLMPLVGGIIADRYLGFRKAIVFGAILLCLGHLGMAFEGAPAVMTAGEVVRDQSSLQVFYFSMAFIIMGVGFLKPNISGIVGQLYTDGDPRRDGGFTIFYMGINFGAMTSAIFCGYLGQTYGWSYGFGLAGIGMLLGLITFIRWRDLYAGAGEPSNPERLKEPFLGPVNREWFIYLCGIAGIVVAWQLMQNREIVGNILLVATAIVVVGVTGFSVLRCTPVERNRMLVVLFLTAVSVVFWAFFEQAGSSMSLFTERNVDRNLFGLNVLSSQLQFFNPGYILLFAPVFASLWLWLSKRGWEPSTPAKFGLGIVQVGLGFGALVMGANSATVDGSVALYWLALAYLLHTTGELCLSPVGLSMVTRFSVPSMVGLMMGVWFLASSLAHYVAGLIAAGASVESVPGEVIDKVASLAVYSNTFGYLAKVAVAVGVVVLVIAPLLNRYLHVDHEANNN